MSSEIEIFTKVVYTPGTKSQQIKEGSQSGVYTTFVNISISLDKLIYSLAVLTRGNPVNKLCCVQGRSQVRNRAGQV